MSENKIVHDAGIADADEDTGNHLKRGMSHKFFQLDLGEFLGGQNGNGFRQFRKKLRLLVSLSPDAHGIMADNDSENEANGELKRGRAVRKSGENGKRRDRGRVAAGHSSIAKKPFQLPCLTDNGVDDDFQHLRNKPGGKAGKQKGIGDEIRKPVQKRSPFG